MKIYNKIVIDMVTDTVIYEDSYEYKGPIALCGGGGGPSGAVDFPDYMEKIHVNWLTGGTTGTPAPSMTTPVEDVMNTAIAAGGNPYDSENAFDPGAVFTPTSGSPLDTMQDEHDSVETLIDAVDPEGSSGLFKSYIDKAVTEVDAVLVTNAQITTAVNAFDDSDKVLRLQELSRWTGGMADINAVHSSQFVIGMALRESIATMTSNRFEQDLRIQLARDRQQMILTAVNMMFDMFTLKATASLDLVRLQGDVSRTLIIAKQEQTDRDLEIDVRDATWDLTVFQYGANLLAGISGAGSPVVEGLTKTQSAISGMFAGASIGASVGGPWGAGIGAAIGLATTTGNFAALGGAIPGIAAKLF